MRTHTWVYIIRLFQKWCVLRPFCSLFFLFRKILWAKCGKFMESVEKTTQKNRKVSTGSSSWAITAKRKWAFASFSPSLLLWRGLPGGAHALFEMAATRAHQQLKMWHDLHTLLLVSCYEFSFAFFASWKRWQKFWSALWRKKVCCFRITVYFWNPAFLNLPFSPSMNFKKPKKKEKEIYKQIY